MHVSVDNVFNDFIGKHVSNFVGFCVQPRKHLQKDQKNAISHIRKIILLREQENETTSHKEKWTCKMMQLWNKLHIFY